MTLEDATLKETATQNFRIISESVLCCSILEACSFPYHYASDDGLIHTQQQELLLNLWSSSQNFKRFLFFTFSVIAMDVVVSKKKKI